ncbi:GNAT family N-acetyltransferase [Streptosporangium canum]|uniref:GNAT family N-acetyltransferase n=1 Tax=Streptosporangium canum TaxID=324952 RepID=UPI0033A7E736
MHVRDATIDDLDIIAAVAAAAGQDEEWTGADPAYVGHLLSCGRVVVAEHRGAVTGFGAIRRIGNGPEETTMLCDLFVDPRSHGLGAGRAMLAALWGDGSRRMTFSSVHSHALPLYTRSGLDGWWPLLYLAGDVRALRVPGGWAVSAAGPGEVADLEERWTGIDRAADHRAWAARPSGQAVVAGRDGEMLAAGTVAGAGTEYGIVHLATAPHADADAVRDAVVAVLASLDPPGGRARVCLPAPHRATRSLLAAGWRNDSFDLFMATDPGLLDPRRAVPSPALA